MTSLSQASLFIAYMYFTILCNDVNQVKCSMTSEQCKECTCEKLRNKTEIIKSYNYNEYFILRIKSDSIICCIFDELT